MESGTCSSTAVQASSSIPQKTMPAHVAGLRSDWTTVEALFAACLKQTSRPISVKMQKTISASIGVVKAPFIA